MNWNSFFRRSPHTWLRAASADIVRKAQRRPLQDRVLRDIQDIWPMVSDWRFGLVVVVIAFLAAAILSAVPLDPPRIGTGVLEAFFQVQGALLGLSVAVSIFAYQSLGQAQGSRRRLILLTGHPASIVIGLALVFLLGAAVVDQFHELTQWLGLIGISLMAGWLLGLLLPTLAHAPRLQDQRVALQMRTRALRRNTARAVRQLLIRRSSEAILRDRLQDAGGTWNPWLSPGEESELITASQAGTVVDISIARLESAARVVANAGGVLTVAVSLDQSVQPGMQLASSSLAIPDRVTHEIGSAIVLGEPSKTPSLTDDLLDLHADAVTALDSSPDVLDSILEAYYSVLEDYASAWSVFTDAVEPENLPTWPETGEAPTAQIRDSILHLFERSIDRRFRDSAFSLAYFPVGVLQRAVRWHAPGYFDFVSLYLAFYFIATRASVAPDMRDTFSERAWLHPVEARELILPALARRQQGELAAIIERATASIDATLLGVLRLSIREKDVRNFKEGLRRWRIAIR